MSSSSSAVARPAPAFAPSGRSRVIRDLSARLYAAGAALVRPLRRQRRDPLDGLSAYMLKDVGMERLELPRGLVDFRPLPQFGPNHRAEPEWPAEVRRALDFTRGL